MVDELFRIIESYKELASLNDWEWTDTEHNEFNKLNNRVSELRRQTNECD